MGAVYNTLVSLSLGILVGIGLGSPAWESLKAADASSEAANEKAEALELQVTSLESDLVSAKLELVTVQRENLQLADTAQDAISYWQAEVYHYRQRLGLHWEQPTDSNHVTQWTPLASGPPSFEERQGEVVATDN